MTDVAQAPPTPWNLPNLLTVLRILGVPVFLWVLLHDLGRQSEWRWAAVGIFVLLMLTDRVDGALARRRNIVTDFGRIADPIADKALMVAGLVGLNLIGALPWWPTAIIVIRELGITGWRMVLLRRGLVVPASRGGKLKTVTQAVAVGLFLVPLGGWVPAVAWVVMAAALIVTVVTGVQYLLARGNQP